MKKPLVTIACITYNHEKFVLDCLKGIFMQECDFDYEVIIHDDCSTDNTQEIIKDFISPYKEKVTLIFQKENQYSQGKKPLTDFVIPMAKGKYIAICEGDDYWTDSLKLQKQVQFLESNDKIKLCYHKTLNKSEINGKQYFFHEPSLFFTKKNIINKKYFLRRGGGAFATPSCMIHKDVIKKLDNLPKLLNGDTMIAISACLSGEIGYIKDLMAVYRVQTPGSWSEKTKRNAKEHYKSVIINTEKVINIIYDEEIKKGLKSYINYNNYFLTIELLKNKSFSDSMKEIYNRYHLYGKENLISIFRYIIYRLINRFFKS